MALWVAGFAGLVSANPVPPPDWAGQLGSVYHYYTFPDDSFAPEPQLSTNAFGAASAAITLGPYGAGWRDPDDPEGLAMYGAPGHGAWDLGRTQPVSNHFGRIDITVPIAAEAAPPGSGGWTLDFVVNIVGYVSLHQLPTLAVVGYEPASMMTMDSFAFFDEKLGIWMNRTWTGSVSGVMEQHLTFSILSDYDGSLIDTVEVHMIPEPSAAWWALVSVAAAIQIRRRRSARRRINGTRLPPPVEISGPHAGGIDP